MKTVLKSKNNKLYCSISINNATSCISNGVNDPRGIITQTTEKRIAVL